MRKAAVINDLSGMGRCSLTAALPVLSALGIQCCPVATAVLTGQTGYPCYHSTDLTDMLPLYADAWKKNAVHFDGIYTGFMTGPEQICRVIDFVAEFRENDNFLLVDPITGDDGKRFAFCSAEFLADMKKLTRRADMITPNLTEACLLADISPEQVIACRDTESAVALATRAAETLRALAEVPQDIVVTGIKCREDAPPSICNLVLTSDGTHVVRSPFFDKSFSGTGDLFASVLCGCHLRGMRTEDAAELAARFLYLGIADTVQEPSDRNDGINFEKFLGELIRGTETLT